jgi:hypothetical protein
MTFIYKNIEAFIDLLQNTPELFNSQDRQTFADKIPEDIEAISESLLAWCEKRPEILDALRQVRRNLPEEEPQFKGVGGTFPDGQTQEEYEKHLRETLINGLRRSSPPENPKPKTPKG